MNYLQYFHQILYREIIEDMIEFCNSHRKSRMIFIINVERKELSEDVFNIIINKFSEK